MIAYLIGKISFRGKDSLTVLTDSGVGYQVKVSSTIISQIKINEKVEFFIYTKVSDQAIDLYGFTTIMDRDFFTLLLSVSGVGPKSAIGIMNLGSMEDITSAIGRGDTKYLTNILGMGKKTAERICVELKNKVNIFSFETVDNSNMEGDIVSDVFDGLTSMGYGRDEVLEVLKFMDTMEKNTEELLREALKLLSK